MFCLFSTCHQVLCLNFQCGLVNNSPGSSNTSECYQTCTGNPSQKCGGPNRLSLYSRAVPKPIFNSGENLFELLGCYADTQGARLLSHSATVPGGSANVSVLECTKACIGRGFTLAGLEYAGGMPTSLLFLIVH